MHLAYINEHGYTTLTISDIADSIKDPTRPLPERVVGITFDDGFADFFTNALPLLEQHKVKATLYITAGYVGSTSRWLGVEGEGDRVMLNWDQIREITRHNVEIGAHTLNHYHLDTLDRATAYREIAGSKAGLEQQLGQPVNTFAYPHGYHDKNIEVLVQQAGFTSACAVKNSLSSSEDDPFALARIIVSRDTGVPELANLLSGMYLPRTVRGERLRTKIWRVVRRVVFRVTNRRQMGSGSQMRNYQDG